jgi:hypothetical protein
MNTVNSKTNRARIHGKLIFIFIVVIGFLLGVVALGNYFLNPMIYRVSYMRETAQALENGASYGIYDTNINWRALRREQIKLKTTSPQVIVSGGSRWQEASLIHTPGKTFFNAFGHSDFNEDFFAIVGLLEKNNKMPDTLVLSLRYSIFAPLPDRDATGWKEWAPEYKAMMSKLGLKSHSWNALVRKEHWFALFSIADLIAAIKRRINSEEHPQILAKRTSNTLDMIRADGSLQWSDKNLKLFTPSFAEKDASKRLNRYKDSILRVDQSMVDATDKLFGYLKSKNVRVVLAQTPFHPTFYDGIKDREYGRTLDEIEAIGRQLAEKHNMSVIGSFDPLKVGCSKDEFIDWHHGTPECLAKIFAQTSF